MKFIKSFESFESIENSNIYQKNLGSKTTINMPIIGDAIEILSNDPNAVKFDSKEEFEKFKNLQRYFSASYSHCFYSNEESEYFHKNGSKYLNPDAENSVMLFEVGRELVAIWDNKNQIGYVLPKSNS